MREFWKLPLKELDPTEWEALCDGCAKCCYVFSHEQNKRGNPCALLDTKTNTCRDYENRFERLGAAYGYECKRITPALISEGNLPETCAYVRRFNLFPLEPWQIEKAKANLGVLKNVIF